MSFFDRGRMLPRRCQASGSDESLASGMSSGSVESPCVLVDAKSRRRSGAADDRTADAAKPATAATATNTPTRMTINPAVMNAPRSVLDVDELANEEHPRHLQRDRQDRQPDSEWIGDQKVHAFGAGREHEKRDRRRQPGEHERRDSAVRRPH